MPTRRGGFTVLEVLIAVGIIMILVAISVIGLRALDSSSRTNDTKVILENLEGMLTEYDAKTKLKNPPSYVWPGPSVSNASAIRLNFWKVPRRVTDDSDAQAVPLVAPGAVHDGAEDRQVHTAIQNTQIAIAMFRTIPAMRTAIAGMPPEKLFIPTWQPNERYAANNAVRSPTSSTTFYKVVGTGFDSGSNASELTDTNLWVPETEPSPLLLDGWRNPVIFVPASGLQVASSRGVVTIKSPDNRPFFASAGPDGNFGDPGAGGTFGDDNVYSFEN